MKQNYFELFQLPVSFQIDPADLAARHRAVIARVHPDQFANKSAVEQRMALQWATFANEAFDTLCISSDSITRPGMMKAA